MASAWGDSWGDAWGLSWGAGVAPPPEEPSVPIPVRSVSRAQPGPQRGHFPIPTVRLPHDLFEEDATKPMKPVKEIIAEMEVEDDDTLLLLAALGDDQ